jgi:hypothetical protein
MLRLSFTACLVSFTALAAEGNLLAGKAPIRVEGVTEVQRLTDGFASPEGDEWKSTRTSIIAPGGFLVWDLGEVKSVRAAMLQGDNNDDYLLEGSVDGNTFTTLWGVHTVGEAGMRLRQIRTLEAQVRYVRLSARGGDNMFSVGEVELHSSPETMADSTLKRQRGRSTEGAPLLLWALTLGAVALVVQSKQKILWVVGAPLMAALGWASVTSLLDRFVG